MAYLQKVARQQRVLRQPLLAAASTNGTSSIAPVRAGVLMDEYGTQPLRQSPGSRARVAGLGTALARPRPLSLMKQSKKPQPIKVAISVLVPTLNTSAVLRSNSSVTPRWFIMAWLKTALGW